MPQSLFNRRALGKIGRTLLRIYENYLTPILSPVKIKAL